MDLKALSVSPKTSSAAPLAPWAWTVKPFSEAPSAHWAFAYPAGFWEVVGRWRLLRRIRVLLQHQGLPRRNARAAQLGLSSPLTDALHSLSSTTAHHRASTRSPLRTRAAIGALLAQGGLSSDAATGQGLPQSLLVLHALSKAHLVPLFLGKHFEVLAFSLLLLLPLFFTWRPSLSLCSSLCLYRLFHRSWLRT